MRVYERGQSHLYCGHWNGSPVEIGMSAAPLYEIPAGEVRHYHDYHEYYVMLEGRATLEVEGIIVPLIAGAIVMVEPGERHQIVAVDPREGARWAIIKERSLPESKHVVSDH